MARYPQREHLSRCPPRAAVRQRSMAAGDPATTRFDELLSRHPDEIGHLQRRPTHLLVSGRLVFLPRGRQRQGIQWTGGGAEMAVGKV